MLASKRVSTLDTVGLQQVAATDVYMVVSTHDVAFWRINRDVDYNVVRAGHSGAVVSLYTCTGGLVRALDSRALFACPSNGAVVSLYTGTGGLVCVLDSRDLFACPSEGAVVSLSTCTGGLVCSRSFACPSIGAVVYLPTCTGDEVRDPSFTCFICVRQHDTVIYACMWRCNRLEGTLASLSDRSTFCTSSRVFSRCPCRYGRDTYIDYFKHSRSKGVMQRMPNKRVGAWHAPTVVYSKDNSVGDNDVTDLFNT